MKQIDKKKLEEVLNQIPMDDSFNGRRPSVVIAQLYFESNLVSNEQVSEVEVALNDLVADDELDTEYDKQRRQMVFFLQKFGSKAEEYLNLLADAVAEAESIKEARAQLSTDWGKPKASFFDRDAQWYYAVVD